VIRPLPRDTILDPRRGRGPLGSPVAHPRHALGPLGAGAPGARGPIASTLKQLLSYWGVSCDWRCPERELNSSRALPRGARRLLDPLLHERGERRPRDSCLILPGWPSRFRRAAAARALADQSQCARHRRPCFDVVIPSLPPGLWLSGARSRGRQLAVNVAACGTCSCRPWLPRANGAAGRGFGGVRA